MKGPGKYDDLCTYVREQAKADGAIVLILDGERGWGFSVQAPLVHHLLLPQLLRDVADQMQHDMEHREFPAP